MATVEDIERQYWMVVSAGGGERVLGCIWCHTVIGGVRVKEGCAGHLKGEKVKKKCYNVYF